MKYYLYQHIRLDTEEVFYIGKGTKKLKGNVYHRAYTKNSRNEYWKNIINQTAYRVEILEEFDIEELCLLRETELIILHGYSWNNTGTLCNMVKDDSEIKILARKASVKSNSKNVHQYSLAGDYIKSFSSISEAKKEHPCDIYNAVSGRTPTAGGFQWRTTKYDKLDPYCVENSRMSKSKVILQYDLNGNFIKKWNGTKIPSVELNINRGAIRNCLSGISKTAEGFIWRYE